MHAVAVVTCDPLCYPFAAIPCLGNSKEQEGPCSPQLLMTMLCCWRRVATAGQDPVDSVHPEGCLYTLSLPHKLRADTVH